MAILVGLVMVLLVVLEALSVWTTAGVMPAAFQAEGCATGGPPPVESVRAASADDGIPGTYVVDAPDAGVVVDGKCPTYRSFPPAVGPMASSWANCGYYESPVPPTYAVHSLYNGAVWISYDPGLDARSLAVIRATATSSPQVLASPVEGLPAPVVLTAWKHQIQLDDVDDPRFDEFVDSYLFTPDRPAVYASCRYGVGRPIASMWSGGAAR